MLQFGQVAALGTVVFTSVLLLRNAVAWFRLRNESGANLLPYGSAVLTQVLAWGAGILAVYLVVFAGLGRAFSLGNQSLVDLGGWAKVMIGLMSASTLSTVNEVKKALDNTDSAMAPPLLSTKTTIKDLTSSETGSGSGNQRVRHVVVPGGAVTPPE
jgi:hypothetical protein